MLARNLVKYPIFAAIIAIFLAIFPWLDWLSSIIIAIMVFGEAITASVITLLLVSMLETWHYDFHWNLAALADQLSFYLIWLGAMVLRKDWHWDRLLNGLAIAGLVTILVVHALIPGLHVYWESKLNEGLGELNQLASTVLGLVNTLQGGEFLTQTWANIAGYLLAPIMLKLLAFIATALWLSGVIFASLFNLGLARWWQHKVMGVGNLHEELMAFRLHRLFGVFMILLPLLYWLKPGWSWSVDALAWVTVVTSTAGILYSYWQIGRWPLPWLWGALALVGFIFYPLIGLCLLSGLGTLDSLMNLRRFQE